VKYFFRNVHLALIQQVDTVIQQTVKGLTELHHDVLRLLEVPHQAYTALQDQWWEFACRTT
jgi:hypothetical protein